MLIGGGLDGVPAWLGPRDGTKGYRFTDPGNPHPDRHEFALASENEQYENDCDDW